MKDQSFTPPVMAARKVGYAEGGMNKRGLGTAYERAACRYLEEKGYQILERNVHNRYGEIDIIARDGRFLVFIEVKYRKDGACGDPAEAVGWHKQIRISRVADWYLGREKLDADTPCRFDVIAVTGKKIRHIRDAFAYVPAKKCR